MSVAPSRPCGTCPYRTDVPSGVWSAEEYAKLPPYDAETPEQPHHMFFCHQQDGKVCSGWVGCHDMDNSLALRLASAFGHITHDDERAILAYESPVPLFASGSDAAKHGLEDIETPGPRARSKIARLDSRLRERDGQ